jgi:hypothetical protein
MSEVETSLKHFDSEMRENERKMRGNEQLLGRDKRAPNGDVVGFKHRFIGLPVK